MRLEESNDKVERLEGENGELRSELEEVKAELHRLKAGKAKGAK